jgi:hypothetical protein
MSDMTRPGASFAAVTASDTTDIAKLNGLYPRALWVGVAGNIAVVAPDSTVRTFEGVPAGTMLSVQFKRVNSTNTTNQTATSMVAVY